jgi:hypothetical protein
MNKQKFLGWDNLLRGKISKLWSKAYLTYQSPRNNNPSPTTGWSAKIIIPILWEYTSSLWEHRSGILQCCTIKEIEARELEALKLQITTAYEEYTKDHFIIPRYLSSLFTSHSLQFWLHSVWEAKAT